jgi:hypothetical protein
MFRIIKRNDDRTAYPGGINFGRFAWVNGGLALDGESRVFDNLSICFADMGIERGGIGHEIR